MKMAGKKSGKKFRIAWIAALAVSVAIAGAVYGGYHFLISQPQPKVDGEIKVGGLIERVEVIREADGKPHIYAGNMHDLFFAQGYVQAQDRWWQMEFFRKTCGGRIEELTGRKDALVNADIYLRSLGLYKIARTEYDSYRPEERAPLDAFAAGVNAFIATRKPRKLSVNYTILGLTGIKFAIEPWSPLDTLVFSKLMAWDLGLSRDMEITRTKLHARLGAEMAEQWLLPPWPIGKKPTILQDVDIKNNYSTNTGYGQPSQAKMASSNSQTDDHSATDMSFVMGQTEGTGSNSWVATGNMTKGGNALLANDPHLGIQQPSIWYEIALHCPDDGTGRPFDVSGFSFALSPGILAGHNNNIAWGNTNVYPDVNDQYQIRANPENPLQYEWNGKWRDMTIHKETIRFGNGKPPVDILVRVTHLGPIVNDNKFDAGTGKQGGFNNQNPLALRWTGLDPGSIVLAILKLNRAGNWDEFVEALKYWDTPSQSIIYADRQGNIGYQMPGKIPVRAKSHTGQLPVPGWTDEFAWKGYVPYNLLPRLYNPARKHIIACNQEVAPPEYYEALDRKLGADVNANFGSRYNKWVYGYRSQRAGELLTQLAPHTVDTFKTIQGDNRSIPAQEILPALAALTFGSQELADVRDWLVKWDSDCGKDSPHAVLFNHLIMKLAQNVFQPRLEGIAKADGIDKELWAITLLLNKPDDPWWDNPSTKDIKETRDQVLAKSFEEGYAAAKAAQGNDREKWKWGEIHQAVFISNPLGASKIKPLEYLVNRGPTPVSGTTESINNTIWYAGKGHFQTGVIPSMRMIIDLGDFDNSLTINSTGASGHPGSRWYGDQIIPWSTLNYQPMLWSRPRVEAAARHRLWLNP